MDLEDLFAGIWTAIRLRALRTDIWIIEAVSAVFFGWVLMRELSRSPTTAFLLLIAFAYGLILEILNMYIFKSYGYNANFALQLFGAPIAIGFFWAMILVSSMKITDSLGVSEWAKPFSDGALCVLIDIAMDVVAIRLEYWTWTLRLDEGFFGVPANNFYAWIFVAFSFSACARSAMRQNRRSWLLLVPGFAYLLLFSFFVAVHLFRLLAHVNTEQEQFMFFWTLLVVCFACMLFFRTPVRGDNSPIPVAYPIARTAVHLYFFAAAAVIGLYGVIPYLLLISVVAFALEILIYVWARGPVRVITS